MGEKEETAAGKFRLRRVRVSLECLMRKSPGDVQ